jgi:hypothetical protein
VRQEICVYEDRVGRAKGGVVLANCELEGSGKRLSVSYLEEEGGGDLGDDSGDLFGPRGLCLGRVIRHLILLQSGISLAYYPLHRGEFTNFLSSAHGVEFEVLTSSGPV